MALLILTSIFLLNAPIVTYSHTKKIDFYDAFEHHGSVIIITDSTTGEILHTNEAASKFYGYTIEELETMKLQDLSTLTPEEIKINMQEIKDKKRHDVITKQRIANGKVRTVEIKSYPYVSGNKAYSIGIVVDITEKIQLEKRERIGNILLLAMVILLLVASILLLKNYRQLKAQSDKISNFNELRKTFLDSYKHLIYLKDEHFKYIFVNKAFENYYKKEEWEIIGYEDFDLSDKEFAENQRKTDIDVLEKKGTAIQDLSRNDRIYRETKFPVKLVNGNFGVGAYIEDVTELHINKRNKEKSMLRNQILVNVLNLKFESTQEQLDYVLNESLKLTESKFGDIFLYDEESQELIPKSWLKYIMEECEVAKKLIKYQLEKTDLWSEVVLQRKPIIVNDYKMQDLMKTTYSKNYVKLSKLMYVPIIIDDKIVAVVGLANKEFEYDNNDIYQITTLMNEIWNVKERREALVKLEVERDKFLKTLMSIGDGVIVVDLDGKVTMLNKVAEKLTGWTIKEAEGRHYKEVFVLSHENKESTINDPIEGLLTTDIIQELGENDILTSKDGTKYCLEDSATSIKDDKGNTIGVVLIFRDVTEKKERRKKIEYLSFHDSLTGLYNRTFFDEELSRLDRERNLPISIIVGDMNGLKLTNDIFGHAAGDELLQKMAEVFKKVCRADDIIARVGGDEFTILLPKTKEEEAKKIISRVKKQFSNERVKAIKGSISMGCDTKKFVKDDILQILNNAEHKMYSAKTLDRIEVQGTTIKTIIDTLHSNSPMEVKKSKNVSNICEIIGKEMNLSEVDIKRLKEAGFLHNIGKIVLDKELLNKNEAFTVQEQKEIGQHLLVGYRILNSFDDTLDLAEIILAYQERWDGKGIPKGLKGEEIPKLARIIAIAESYDTMINRQNSEGISKEQVVEEIRNQAGVKFDPEIVDIFIKNILEKNI